MLIVEDNPVFREALKAMVARRFPGLPIDTAEDLAEARGKLRQRRPEVVLLDLCLPDGNGLELVPEVRASAPGAAVAICTSHDLPEYREAAARLGILQFFVKQSLDLTALDSLVWSSR